MTAANREPSVDQTGFQTLLDAAAVGLLQLDDQGRCVAANRFALQLLRLDPRSVADGILEPTCILRDADGRIVGLRDVSGFGDPQGTRLGRTQRCSLSFGSGEVNWLDLSVAPIDEGRFLVTLVDATAAHFNEALLLSRSRIARLALTGSLEEMLRAVLDEVENLTGGSIGFFHFVDANQEELSLQTWSTRTQQEFCRAEGRGAHYPVSRAGVWVDGLKELRPVIHNDYPSVPHRKGLPQGHAVILRELVVPVIRGQKAVALLGTGNKATPYVDRDVEVVQKLADLAWDLAERKLAEQATVAAETRYRTLFEESPVGVWEEDFSDVRAELDRLGISDSQSLRERLTSNPDLVVNLAHRVKVVDVNETCVRELQASSKEDVLVGLNRFFIPESLSVFQEELLAFYEGRSIFRGEAPLRDMVGRKRLFALVARVHPGCEKDWKRVFITRVDVTQRVMAERQLTLSEERHRMMLSTALDGVWLTDHAGRFVETNEAACRMLGYDHDEMRELSIADIEDAESAEATRRHIAEILLVGADLFESRHRCKDGRVIDVEVSVTVLRDSGHFLAYVRDTTERKRAEQQKERLQAQLARSQQLASLGSLAGGVAHDINNVLGAILGLASTNLDELPAHTPMYEDLNAIVRACQRGAKLAQGLLGFARQKPVENREVDLSAVIREVRHLLERTALAKVEVRSELVEDLPHISGDGSAIGHALMNLCINSADAMPTGGRLTLRSRNLDPNMVEIQVEDDGCGMPQEVLVRAIDPFFTTKAPGKGTGLGLAMVYGTVTAHGGAMDIESVPGLGTKVCLRFPTSVRRSRSVESTAAVTSPGTARLLSVLFVDDDELARNACERMLVRLGHSVTSVGSGEEALARLESGKQVDLVILDINMPGLGGHGTLPIMKTRWPSLRVLLATGRSDQEAVDLAASHPGVTLLTKPFGMQDLRKTLANLTS